MGVGAAPLSCQSVFKACKGGWGASEEVVVSSHPLAMLQIDAAFICKIHFFCHLSLNHLGFTWIGRNTSVFQINIRSNYYALVALLACYLVLYMGLKLIRGLKPLDRWYITLELMWKEVGL